MDINGYVFNNADAAKRKINALHNKDLRRQRIIEYLNQKHTPIHFLEICSSLGIPPATKGSVFYDLKSLVKQGLVVKYGRGEYGKPNL